MTAPLAVHHMIAALVASMAMSGAVASVQGDEVQEKVPSRLVREETQAVSIHPHGALGFSGASLSEGASAPPYVPTGDTDRDDPAQYSTETRPPTLGSYHTPAPSPVIHPIVTTQQSAQFVLEGTKADNCPWLNGVSTGSNSMLCWDATTCDPSTAGDACCMAKGGVLQCPDTLPLMCQKKSCGGDHCCKVDCTDQEGIRQCVAGPLGSPGSPGAPGPTGTRGDEGTYGHEGEDGKYGKEGPPGETGPEGPASTNSPPASAATMTLLIAVAVVNALLAIGMYFFLKVLKHVDNKKAAANASF